ncbi:NUDIX domain-containing protein [candidate division WOR-3 bacterium]|nr:NUDIX domain-containing protein [candidate division WOR-3 bacterium]
MIRGSFLMLSHQKGAANTFLPGGHIELGEAAHAALARELEEELGTEVEVKEFLGAVEHSWQGENGSNHEINLIFRMECGQLETDELPLSQESHLEFFWQPVEDLASVRLEPSALIELLPGWLFEKSNSGWGSTINNPKR